MLHRVAAVIISFLLAVFILSPVLRASVKEPVPTWEEKYKDEPYVLLKKERVIRINKDYTFSETMYKKATIQKEEGKSVGEIKLNYDQSREEIRDIEAYTITPDGKKLPYEKIQDLNTSVDKAMYSDERVKVISMPNVVKGSIIEWKATYFTRKPTVPNHFYDHFHFTHDNYPVKELTYKIIAPKDMKLYFKKQNTEIEPRVENTGGDTVYTWELKDTDKMQNEEYMPPSEELNQIVFISTLTDWKQVSDWAWNLFRKNLSITPEIKQTVQELTRDKKTTAEKIQSVIEYIRSEFRYVAMNMDTHNFEPHPVPEIFANKYGDCKDHTLLAMAMLSELGVKAWPVALSNSIDLKKDASLPMPFFFDHAFLYFELEDKQYYTDVLLKEYTFDEVPSVLAEKKVFIINDTGGFFTTLPAADRDEVTISVHQNVTIRSDGTSMVILQTDFSRSISVAMRQKFNSLNAEYKEKALAAFEKSVVDGGDIVEKSWNGIDTPNTRINFTVKYEDHGLVERMGNMMVFGIPKAKRGALFSAPKRKHPLVFHALLRTEQDIYYTLPQGYEAIEIPNKVLLQRAFADYIREYASEGSIITGRETLAFNSINLSADEYLNVQNFYDDIARMTVKKVVIRQKEDSPASPISLGKR